MENVTFHQALLLDSLRLMFLKPKYNLQKMSCLGKLLPEILYLVHQQSAVTHCCSVPSTAEDCSAKLSFEQEQSETQ